MRNLDEMYEYKDIVTHSELHTLAGELEATINALKWYHIREKIFLTGGYNTIAVLIKWLHAGKPMLGGTDEIVH